MRDGTARHWNNPCVRDDVTLRRWCLTKEAAQKALEEDFGMGLKDPWNGKDFGMRLPGALNEKIITRSDEGNVLSLQCTKA